MAQYTHSTSWSRWLRMVSIAIAVLPVWRSPRISSRWPRPTGMSASITMRPVWRGTVTGERSMMGGEGRSMGRRLPEATGPLPSSGRPSGSMTRPSSPSPTATSMTRPVRWTSSPAWRCQYSPSRTTPISFSSTLNAMPSTSPGNISTSSKPTPGRPDTLAIPVATLVIVPTSRGVSFGVNASRTSLMPANTLSKTFWRLSGSMLIAPLFLALVLRVQAWAWPPFGLPAWTQVQAWASPRFRLPAWTPVQPWAWLPFRLPAWTQV